jgi:hypothetical protein
VRLRRNPPVSFITNDEAFTRLHSTAWATEDGHLYLLKPGYTHAQDIPWGIFQECAYMGQGQAYEMADADGMEIQDFIMSFSHWIAVSNPFEARTEYPLNPEAMKALAFYLASAVIWYARRGMNHLDTTFLLWKAHTRDASTGRLVVGDIIHRYVAPEVEAAMYNVLMTLPAPVRPSTLMAQDG